MAGQCNRHHDKTDTLTPCAPIHQDFVTAHTEPPITQREWSGVLCAGVAWVRAAVKLTCTVDRPVDKSSATAPK